MKPDDQHKSTTIQQSFASLNVSKIPGIAENASPVLTLHSASSKSPPECQDPEFPNALFTMESMQEEERYSRMKSVLLSKMQPSINLSVLQSHFLIPNRPRDFRIFEPRQISYGPFFLTPPDQILRNPSSSFSSSSEPYHYPLDQLEIGCLISFSDANTAAHFCRVLQHNSPFDPLQVRLVDPAVRYFPPPLLSSPFLCLSPVNPIDSPAPSSLSLSRDMIGLLFPRNC
jgi:hypothetical protein